MRVRAAEQHALGHDDRRPPARLEQTEEERQEQQLRLLRLHDLLQVLGRGLVVERAGERRIGQDQRVLLLLPGVVLGQRVAVGDVGVLHAVQQHVHAADAQHGVVEVVAVEEGVVEVPQLLLAAEELRMPPAEVLANGHEEAGRTAGGIADDVVRPRRHQFDHQLDDVPRSAELPVLPSRGDLAEAEVRNVSELYDRPLSRRVGCGG